MNDKSSVVAIFDSHEKAEDAVKELQRAGFDMKELSIVGRDIHSDEHVVGFYNTGDRMAFWGKLGALWGGLWGLLFGTAFFWVPGIGAVLVGGPLVAAIVAALEGAAVVGGLSAIGAALYSLGIPKDSVLRYERALRSDSYLLLAHGAHEELKRAKDIMERAKATETAIHE